MKVQAHISEEPPLENYQHRPGNLASLGKQSVIMVLVHLVEMMKRIFISLSRYWWERYINDSN